MIDLRTRAERQAYSEAKHYLGPLCIRQHDAGDGRSWRHLGHGNCVECTREGARRWKLSNPDRAAENTRRRDLTRHNKDRRRKWPFAVALGPPRNRARKLGIAFSLTADDMRLIWKRQDGKCFWTGRAIDFWEGDERHPFRPSLDRLDPVQGYVPGNVVWASNFANRGRGACLAPEFARMMIEMGFDGPFRSDARIII